MADNISVTVTADVVDLKAQFAVARAEASALTSELNKLARQAAQGDMTAELKASLLAASEAALKAQNNVAGLRKELETAQGSTSVFSNAVAGMSASLESFIGLASAAMVARFGEGLVSSAAEIQHESEVLSMSTTAFQDFTVSAQLAGVEVGAAETAIRKFNASQGAAQQGVKAQADAFKQLGVDAALPAEEALPAVARALLNMQDAALKSRLEVQLFGKAGEELNPALEQWAQGTDALTKKLSDLGVILDEKTVKAAHDSEIALTLLELQIKTEFTPIVVEAGTALVGTTEKLQEFDGWLVKTLPAVESLVNPLGAIARSFNDLSGAHVPAPPNQQSGSALSQSADGSMTWGGDQGKHAKSGAGAANRAREEADAVTQAWQQANLDRIAGAQATNTFLLEMGQQSVEQFITQAKDLENQRYQIELNALKQKEAADAGNPVAFARDRAQEEVIYQQHINKLTALDQDYAKRKQQIDQTALQEFIAEDDARLREAIDNLNKEYEAHLISAQERRDAEINLTLAIEKEVLARFDAEHAGLDQGTEAYALAMKQRQAIIEGFNKEIIAANNQLSAEETKTWNEISQGIVQSFGSAFRQMMTQGFTLKSFLGTIADGILNTFATLGEKMLENWVSAQIGMAAAGEVASKTASVGQISAAAGVAFANTYAQTAAIPVIGPELAPAAAAAAQAAVLAQESLVLFDVGTNFVPRDMPAMVHQGERIIPRADNEALMAALNGGGGGGSAPDVSFNISAMDTRSSMKWIQQMAPYIASVVGKAWTKNSNLRPAY